MAALMVVGRQTEFNGKKKEKKRKNRK